MEQSLLLLQILEMFDGGLRIQAKSFSAPVHPSRTFLMHFVRTTVCVLHYLFLVLMEASFISLRLGALRCTITYTHGFVAFLLTKSTAITEDSKGNHYESAIHFWWWKCKECRPFVIDFIHLYSSPKEKNIYIGPYWKEGNTHSRHWACYWKSSRFNRRLWWKSTRCCTILWSLASRLHSPYHINIHCKRNPSSCSREQVCEFFFFFFCIYSSLTPSHYSDGALF